MGIGDIYHAHRHQAQAPVQEGCASTFHAQVDCKVRNAWYSHRTTPAATSEGEQRISPTVVVKRVLSSVARIVSTYESRSSLTNAEAASAGTHHLWTTRVTVRIVLVESVDRKHSKKGRGGVRSNSRLRVHWKPTWP